VSIRRIGRLVAVTFRAWLEDESFRLSASVAFYAIFSMAPALIVIVAIVNAVYSGNTEAEIQNYIARYVGPQAAQMITAAVRTTAQHSGSGLIPTTIGIVSIVVGASAVFAELQTAMNRIWEIEVDSGGLGKMIRARVLGFLIVLLIAGLLLASVLLATVISFFRNDVVRNVSGAQYVLPYVEAWISFGVLVVVYAVLFKILPDADVHWRDVWIGAVFTAGLFALGKYGIAYYLSESGSQSAYGAAGVILVVLAWIYYSTLIFFLGAEFTQTYANFQGRAIVPKPYARLRTRHAGPHGPGRRGDIAA
jgi:membrane protein